MKRLLTAAALLIAGVSLSGCLTSGGVGSVLNGECKLGSTPEYAVRGKLPYDQRWINRTTEAMVSGCGQPRPRARPAEWDKPTIATFAPTPVKKRRFQRIRKFFGS